MTPPQYPVVPSPPPSFGEGRGAGKPAIAEVSPLLAKSRAASGLEGRARSAVSGADDVVETVLFPVVNEGCRVIAEVRGG